MSTSLASMPWCVEAGGFEREGWRERREAGAHTHTLSMCRDKVVEHRIVLKTKLSFRPPSSSSFSSLSLHRLQPFPFLGICRSEGGLVKTKKHTSWVPEISLIVYTVAIGFGQSESTKYTGQRWRQSRDVRPGLFIIKEENHLDGRGKNHLWGQGAISLF